VNTYDPQRYTEKIASIIYGTPFAGDPASEEVIPETPPLNLEDMLPEEEALNRQGLE
jgi:hypothetical protein